MKSSRIKNGFSGKGGVLLAIMGVGNLVALAHAEELDSEPPQLPPGENVQTDVIRERIKTLHAQQAEYLKKVASGEIKPNTDLTEKWPKIQADVFSMHETMNALNSLSAHDPERPAVEVKLLSMLQQIGLYLAPSDHPPFQPRQLSGQQLAEMKRIENAIENMTFGDRKDAKPVQLISSGLTFTLIHLPVPLVLKSQPEDKIYLVSTTGGAFSNGLSMIELQADENGLASTTWVSIGESVGKCDISIYSQAAIERQEIQIEVVSPNLAIFENLPAPDKALGVAPRLISKSKTIPRP